MADSNIGNFIWSHVNEEKIDVTARKTQGITAALHSIAAHFDMQLTAFMDDLKHLFTDDTNDAST
jgi:hypothetical protein